MGNDLILQQICKVLDLDYEDIKGKLLDPDEAAAVYLAIENLSETVPGILEIKNRYEIGYTGTMYDLAGQGIPLVMPINQLAMVKAVQLSSKVSKRLYGCIRCSTQSNGCRGRCREAMGCNTGRKD